MEQREQLESRKIGLAQMSDFNLIDAFRIFDIDSRGSVTSVQIQNGLSTFLGA